MISNISVSANNVMQDAPYYFFANDPMPKGQPLLYVRGENIANRLIELGNELCPIDAETASQLINEQP